MEPRSEPAELVQLPTERRSRPAELPMDLQVQPEELPVESQIQPAELPIEPQIQFTGTATTLTDGNFSNLTIYLY